MFNTRQSDLRRAWQCARRAVHQERRFQAAVQARAEARERTGLAMQRQRETELNEDINDAFYFLMLATHRVAVLVEVLAERHGYELPKVRQAQLVRSWRDTQEQWDDPDVKGRGVRVLRRWAALESRSTPVDSLATGGLDLKGLREDLLAILAALVDLIESDTGTRLPD